MRNDPNKYHALLLAFLLSLPATAQEIIFNDSFENHAPLITSSPQTTATINEVYSYDVDATDIDNDTLIYLLTVAPDDMNINAASGEILWTPPETGDTSVTVDVSDGEGGSAQQSWSITVTEVQDSDNDGLTDDEEILLGTDPNDSDSDNDGLLDGEEVNLYGTNPLDKDTDDDNHSDGSEVAAGTDPLDANDFPESPVKVTLSPTETVIVIGNTEQLTVTGEFADASVQDLTSEA